MTDNADVEWLRKWEPSRQEVELWIDPVRRASIIAHIDQLEAERVKDQLRIEELQSSVDGCAQRLAAEVSRRSVPDDRRPSVHEIAAQIMAALASHPPGSYRNVERAAQNAYDAAEALVAEGRRRDGNG